MTEWRDTSHFSRPLHLQVVNLILLGTSVLRSVIRALVYWSLLQVSLNKQCRTLFDGKSFAVHNARLRRSRTKDRHVWSLRREKTPEQNDTKWDLYFLENRECTCVCMYLCLSLSVSVSTFAFKRNPWPRNCHQNKTLNWRCFFHVVGKPSTNLCNHAMASPNLFEPYSLALPQIFGSSIWRQPRSRFDPKEVPQQMFDFWARAGLATCSLAANLARMTALLTSTGVLIKMQWLNFAKLNTSIPMQSTPDTGGKQQTVTSSQYHANSTQYWYNPIRRNFLPMPSRMYKWTTSWEC